MKLILMLILSLCIAYNAQSQGCSDAGFCTAGNIKPLGNNDSMKNSIGFSVNYSIGEHGTTIISPQFEPAIKISDKSMVQIKVPFTFINGNLGKINGIGDVILSYNYKLDSLWKYTIILTFGTRIATGSSSLKSNNISLPMPYQPSLGTTDIILGSKIKFNKGFSVSIGFQNPLVNRNQNGFDSAAYKTLLNSKHISKEDNYFISSYLQRKGDIMLRLDKTFTFKKTQASLGILPIYHLGDDKAKINKATTIEMKNSKGLTLNLNAGFVYKINANIEFSTIAATPLIVRNSRPDGLTRSLVLIPGFKYHF